MESILLFPILTVNQEDLNCSLTSCVPKTDIFKRFCKRVKSLLYKVNCGYFSKISAILYHGKYKNHHTCIIIYIKTKNNKTKQHIMDDFQFLKYLANF